MRAFGDARLTGEYMKSSKLPVGEIPPRNAAHSQRLSNAPVRNDLFMARAYEKLAEEADVEMPPRKAGRWAVS
ncbi:MAG: hypothetical protein QOD94_2717 [Alphaproteobacteria bacterium]|jgi:hypothetical protein|nr:hypothetical protein [Alphaproteobacteria bacterium]